MRILTAKQIKKVEQNAFDSGMTEAQLMLAAGNACYARILKILANSAKTDRIGVVCGNGKNAGDGFVIAQLLTKSGYAAEIILADREPEIAEPVMYYEQAVESGVKVKHFTDITLDYDVIIDCIFGIGFHGHPKAPFDLVFEAVNNSSATVISIDTPSGTDATDGSASLAIKADYTIAITTLKFAHILPESNEYCGKIYTVGIGIPEQCFDNVCKSTVQTITKADVKACFPKRKKNSHKGSFGHQLNICGSYRMPGAAVICATAALKAGAGLVKCVFPKSIYGVMTAHIYEALFSPVCENENKTLSMGALTDILEELKWANSVVIGCGIGSNDDTQVITDQIIKSSDVPIVLDADGINVVAPFIDILRDKKAPLVITPHPAEMARLIGESTEYVQAHRIETAKAFASEYGVITVLKGANTIVTDGDSVYVNTNGNSGMAMGGTGDMLSGIIGAFIAQGIEPYKAARCAVFIHGFCGDVTASEISQRGMTVKDMLSVEGAVLSEFEQD